MSGCQESKQSLSSVRCAGHGTGTKRERLLRVGLRQDRLKEVLSYDPETGIFTRLTSTTQATKVGEVVGSLNCKGYLLIMVDNVSYTAHRLAWLYVYGYFPENDIDHINRVRDDNRIHNLREISKSCNVRNSKARKDCKILTGVHERKLTSGETVYRVYININKKRVNLGHFGCLVEAAAHRLAAEDCIGWYFCKSDSMARSIIDRYIKERPCD